MKLRIAVVSSFVFLLVSCAQMVWIKPGAGQNEFAQARYECLQNSQQQRSTATYNNSGGYVSPMASSQGYATSGAVTNEQLFGACMNAKGWYLEAETSNSTNQQSASNSSKLDLYFNAYLSCYNERKNSSTLPLEPCAQYLEQGVKNNVPDSDSRKQPTIVLADNLYKLFMRKHTKIESRKFKSNDEYEQEYKKLMDAYKSSIKN